MPHNPASSAFAAYSEQRREDAEARVFRMIAMLAYNAAPDAARRILIRAIRAQLTGQPLEQTLRHIR